MTHLDVDVAAVHETWNDPGEVFLRLIQRESLRPMAKSKRMEKKSMKNALKSHN
jgi:hypothetical protein